MSEHARTKEAQYQFCVEYAEERGLEQFGLMSSQCWYDDPRRMVFLLARYKFVAKMLEGRAHVLEVGCADAFGTRIVRQAVEAVTAIDFDPVFIEDAKTRTSERWNVDLAVHDLLKGPVPPGNFDAAFALDVLEHIDPKHEQTFIDNVVKSLKPHGAVIFGMPSLESQVYASPQSKAGHVNCKTAPDFKATMEQHFHNVFMFSMNDEIVHTGYHKMAHLSLIHISEPTRLGMISYA